MYLQVPRTTTTITFNDGSTSTRDSFAKFDLLSHLSQPFFFGYSPRGGRKGRMRADRVYLRLKKKQEKPATIYTFSEGWWVSGGYQAGSNGVSPSLVPQRPTHQLVTWSYGSNANHIHQRDISSNYTDNLTLISNDESSVCWKASLCVD